MKCLILMIFKCVSEKGLELAVKVSPLFFFLLRLYLNFCFVSFVCLLVFHALSWPEILDYVYVI